MATPKWAESGSAQVTSVAGLHQAGILGDGLHRFWENGRDSQ
jgi:hypothetical protein